jgi:hypothetical protein
MPDLLENNTEAFMIYPLIRNQVITRGMDGTIVDVNFSSLEFIFDILNIKNKKECFSKVHRLFHHFLRKQDG